MTSVTIELSDKIAKEAYQAGLLDRTRIELLLRAALRERAALGLHRALAEMDSVAVPEMSAAEIAIEIKAARAAKANARTRSPRLSPD